MPLGETITALSTASGESAIGVIRVSGPLVCALILNVFGREEPPIQRFATLGSYRSADGKVLDSVLFTYFEEGHSYTGEALLEIACHGNPLILQNVLEDLVRRGCRHAEPGEFTRTAFLNGKMDLCQAEAVAELIHARNEKALEIANRQLSGGLSRHYGEILDRLVSAIAFLEAYIDFPEEDLPPEDKDGPLRLILQCLDRVERLLSTRHYSTLLHEGIRTVILGAPNAGKSCLLNALMGEERAIVSAEPGTTRDFIAEQIMIPPYSIRITDTAGIHEADSDIERCGIEKTFLKIEEAHICLLVVDTTIPYPTFDSKTWDLLSRKKVLLIQNKIDLSESSLVLPKKEWELFECVSVSAKENTGIDALRQSIVENIEANAAIPEDEDLVVSVRHISALENAKNALNNALQKLRLSEPVELAVSDLRSALVSFGDILGRVDNERVLDEVFSNFCIGK